MPLLSKVNAGNSRVANSRVSSIFAKKVSQKIKRAGPSHKPHPKATCPHPTRPLRPPGRRARDDYAQVEFKMQPQVEKFFRIFRAQTITKIATLEKTLSLLIFTIPQPQQQTRYCEVI